MKFRPSRINRLCSIYLCARLITLGLAVFLCFPSLSSASFCDWMLRHEREFTPESAEAFRARKSYWSKVEPLTIERRPLAPADVLAILETAGERGGYDVLRVGEIVEKDPKTFERLARAVEKVKEPKDLTIPRLRTLFAELYLVSNPPWPNSRIQKSIRRGLPLSVESTIYRHIETRLGEGAVVDGLRELGFLRTPRVLSGFKLWAAKHPVLYDSIRITAWNSFWIATTGFPAVLPRTQYSNLVRMTDDLKNRYKISHPKSLKELSPELRKEIFDRYGITGSIDAGIYAFQGAYTIAILGTLVFFLADPETRVNFWQLGKLMVVMAKHSGIYPTGKVDCEIMRQALWNGFREGFKEMNDRYPDERLTEDRRIYDANHARIFDSPCE